jgi:hypothetical protein
MYNERQSLRIYSCPPPRNTLAFSLSSAHLSIYSISLSRMRRWSSRLRGGVQWNERAHDFLATGAHNLRLIPLVSPQLKCTPLSLYGNTRHLSIIFFPSQHSSSFFSFIFFGVSPLISFSSQRLSPPISLSMMAVATRRAQLSIVIEPTLS